MRAWEPVFYHLENASAQLSFPFDLKMIHGFSPDGCAHFEICSDYQPPPASLHPVEIGMRHFTWLRLFDPVHGGFFPLGFLPERLFVHLFDPEPVSFTQRPSPAAVLDAIAAWRTIAGAKAAITLLITQEQEEDWRQVSYSGEHLDFLVTSGDYPSHHPGLAFVRGIYPYDFAHRRYAWTDFETLYLFKQVLQGDPQSARIPITILGSRQNGIAHMIPFSTVRREELIDEGALLVQGGLLTGEAAQGDEIVAWPHTRSWTALQSSEKREFLWFLNPGLHKDSSSPLFVSRFFPFVLRELGADLRGEKRFCIACNRCETHCPVGLDPQYLWKCLSRGFNEEAQSYGLSRCIECGLCAYACPSKIELLDVLRSARARYAKRLPVFHHYPEEHT